MTNYDRQIRAELTAIMVLVAVAVLSVVAVLVKR